MNLELAAVYDVDASKVNKPLTSFQKPLKALVILE